MLTSRRRFLFGATAVAAPAIIGIDGVMKFFTPAKPAVFFDALPLSPENWTMVPKQLIVSPENEAAAHVLLSAERFREVIEPGLRQLFEEAYGGPEKFRALAERRARLLNRILARPASEA